jgi:hypothetical protein
LSAILFAGFLSMSAAAIGYPTTARAVPLLVGLFGAALSAVQFVRAMRQRQTVSVEDFASLSRGHLAMFVWLVGAAAAVAVLGILAGGAIFVIAFLRGRLGESWSSAVPAGLALSAVLHLMLERGLGVYLFGGLIWR